MYINMPKAEKEPSDRYRKEPYNSSSPSPRSRSALSKHDEVNSKLLYNSRFLPPDSRSDDPNEFNFTVSSITRGLGSSRAVTPPLPLPPPLTVTVNNGSHSELIPTQGNVTGDHHYDFGLIEIFLPSNVSVITANILNYALLDELTLVVKRHLLTVGVILTDEQIVELLNRIPPIFSDSLLKDLLANFNSLIKQCEQIIPGWAGTADGRNLLNAHMDHINFTPRNIIGDGNIPNKCLLKSFSTSQQYMYPDDICPARLEALHKRLPDVFPTIPVLTRDEASQYAYTITVRLDVIVGGVHYIITLKLNPHDPNKTYTNESFNNFIVSQVFRDKIIAAIRLYPVKPEATQLIENLCTVIQGNWSIDAAKCKFVIIESGCARVNQVVDSTGKLDIRLIPYDNTKYFSEDNLPYVRLFSPKKRNKVIRAFLPNGNWFNAIDQWSDKASPVIFRLGDGSDAVPSTGAVMGEGEDEMKTRDLDVKDVTTPRQYSPSVESLQGNITTIISQANTIVEQVSSTECAPSAPATAATAATPSAPSAPESTNMGTKTTIIHKIWNWCTGALSALTGRQGGGLGGVGGVGGVGGKIPTITAKRGRNGLKNGRKGQNGLITRKGHKGGNGRKKGRKGRQMTRKIILACSHLRRSNKKLK